MRTRLFTRPLLIAAFVLLSGCQICSGRMSQVATDVRVSREFLQTIDMFPIAVDVRLSRVGEDDIVERADIICGVPVETEEFVTSEIETVDLLCNTRSSLEAFVRPVDLDGYDCENLSRNGRTSFRFDADKDVLLGGAVNENLFPIPRECRSTSTFTLNIE